MRGRWCVLGVAMLAVVTACSSSARHPTSPSTTSSATSAPNPDVVPATITPAYVDAVFAVLEHIDGNASRALIAAHSVTPTVLTDIRAIYNDPLYQQEVQIARQSLQESLNNVRRPVGDVEIHVLHLISGSPSCIFVATADDYRDVLRNPGAAPASGYWGMKPKQTGADPTHLNPTPWALFFNAVYTTPTSIPNQCASS